LIGIGTTATANATITNGSITATTIVNPGFGYTDTNAPQVLAPLPTYKAELVSNITAVEGFTGIVTGIGTTAGIGTALAIKFHLYSPTASDWSGATLKAGYPISIFDTQIGTGVTSIYNSGSGTVGIGTTFLDNVYRLVHNPSFVTNTGIITCNIASDTVHTGISSSGDEFNPVGQFSWGRLNPISRSSSPIAIGVSGLTVNSGLTTYPTIQRRSDGIRDTGGLDPK